MKNKMTNHHGAQESGEISEKSLEMLLRKFDSEYTRKRRRLYVTNDWSQDGYCYFVPDGYSPHLNAWVELKAGRSKGTTEEKIWFTLEKIEGGAYGDDNLLILFKGTVEKNKNTRRFMRKINEKKDKGDPRYKNVECCLVSELTREVFDTLFSGKAATKPATSLALF